MSLWLKTGDSSLLERVVKKKQVFKRGEVLYRMGQARGVYVCHSRRIGKDLRQNRRRAGSGDGISRGGRIAGTECNRESATQLRGSGKGVTSVCEVSVDRFEELAREDTAIQYEIFKIMSAEIRHGQELLLLLGKHNAEERLAAFLLDLSQQFAKRHCSPTEFNLSMSRSDIGNYLGIAEETVCRIFARFQDDGLVSSECRHIKLNDLKRLKCQPQAFPSHLASRISASYEHPLPRSAALTMAVAELVCIKTDAESMPPVGSTEA